MAVTTKRNPSECGFMHVGISLLAKVSERW